MNPKRKKALLTTLVAVLIVLAIMGFGKPSEAESLPEMRVATLLLFTDLDIYDEPDPEPEIDPDFIFFDVPEWQTFVATAYCACEKCCGYWATTVDAGKTASGAKATQGVTVAMDESVPFGTRIYIQGLGEFICQDRGSAIVGPRIDIYFDSHEDALQYGMQTVNVLFLED